MVSAGKTTWQTVWSGTGGENSDVSANIGNAIAVRITFYRSHGYEVGTIGVTGSLVGSNFACALSSQGGVSEGVVSTWYCHSGGVSFRHTGYDFKAQIKQIDCLY